MSVDQAYVMAVNAVQHGDSQQAIRIIKGLLQARPDDPNLHLLQAAAHAQLQQHGRARKSAARAYRLTTAPAQKITAAELAARSAFVQNRPTMTQLWLRRAAVYAEDEETEKKIAQDYAQVRRVNPFSFSLRGGIKPSDNVNSGTNAIEQVVNGVPVFQSNLSADTRALSGVVGTLDAVLSYRLQEREKSITSLGARLYTRRVALSSDAKRMLEEDPRARRTKNADFATDLAELSFDHLIGLGQERGQVGFGLSFGSVWFGGSGLFDYARARVHRSIPFGDTTWLSLHTSLEYRDSAFSDSNDQTRIRIGGSVRRQLENKDRIQLGLTLEESDGDNANVRSSSATVRGTYTFGQQWGPAEVSTSLTLGYTDFPDFALGIPGLANGREDWSTYADVSFFFKDYDYAGFAPKLRIQAGQVSSNVSSFEAEEISISLEIQSKF